MSIAIIELQAGGSAYLAQALWDEGVPAFMTTDVDDAAASEAALVIIGAPSNDMFRAIAELRARNPAILQLAIVERDDVDLRLAAYAAGADDCVSRPFHLSELAAKLRALRRRALAGATVRLHADCEATLDLVALELRFGGKTKSLTKRESDLLALLARAGGETVSREDVLRDAWGAAPGLTGNLVDVYVGYLRRKMKQLGAEVAIKSARGEGFRISGQSAALNSRRTTR